MDDDVLRLFVRRSFDKDSINFGTALLNFDELSLSIAAAQLANIYCAIFPL